MRRWTSSTDSQSVSNSAWMPENTVGRKNDVLDGIRYVASLLNQDQIAVEEGCINTRKEFASYVWDEKASERGEDKPVKQFDHCMDALRYFCYTIIRKPGGVSILK